MSWDVQSEVGTERRKKNPLSLCFECFLYIRRSGSTQVISCCCDVKSHLVLCFHFAAFPADWPNLWPLISVLTLMTDYTLCILLILLRVTHSKRFKKISAVHIVSDKRQIVTENNLLSIYDLLMATYTGGTFPSRFTEPVLVLKCHKWEWTSDRRLLCWISYLAHAIWPLII